MANICKYRVIVKGKKNACYAFFGSMSGGDKEVLKEFGTNDQYTLLFDGECKWSVDSYCNKKWKGEFPVLLPEGADEAYRMAGENYLCYKVQDRSKMFNVEVFCNSADEDCFREFLHYVSGKKSKVDIPDELNLL